MRSIRRFLLLSFTLLLGVVVPITTGQADLCPALVEQALAQVGDSCVGLGRNIACYGFNRINTTFFTEQPTDFFTEPADLASLVSIESLQTSPLAVDESEWGIAVLNVQADLPTLLPGQAALFLLLGDVQVTNAVPPRLSVETEPISVTTTGALNLRSGPSQRNNVITSVPANTTLLADQQSADGGWLRVLYDDTVGWVSSQFVTTTGNLARLAVQDPNALGTMQSFYLQTGLTGTSCTEAPPSLLVVQAPQTTRVNLTVNGVALSIGSTVAFKANVENGLQIGVIDGSAQTADGTIVPAGFIITYDLDETGQNAQGRHTDLRPFNANELISWETLENIPASLLHYPIDMPSQADINAYIQGIRGNQPTATNNPNANATAVRGQPTPTTEATTEGIIPLTVTTTCSPDFYAARYFDVYNPNGYEVPISWHATTGESAFFFAPPNQTRQIGIGVPPNYEGDGAIGFTADWGTGTAVAISEYCPPQHSG
jgi:hypothetical protein